AGFMEHPARFIGTCLIGLNIFLVIYGLVFDEMLKMGIWNPLDIKNEYLKLAFDTFLSAIVVLIIGEFLPKAIFRAKNDSLLIF
ncbi:CNNM domain-containing protein, partial [Klebsiella pneumoniae]